MICMELDVFKYSSVGGRANNEDYCDCYAGDDCAVLVVADGLGGHDCGEVASEIAVKAVISAVAADSGTDLYEAIAAANEAIIARQAEDAALEKMRTTVVGVKLMDAGLSYANVGDSRFYYFRAGQKLFRSKDHSVPQLAVDMGELSEAEIRFSDDRNKLLKVLGEDENLSLPEEAPVISVAPGDAFILCSDGFWENVFDQEMEIDLAKSKSAEDWAYYMIKRLLLRVSGSHDNFTLICGRIV